MDLNSSIEKAKVLLKAERLKHPGGLSIDIGEPEIRLGRVIIGSDLYVEGLFSSKADAVLSAAH